MRKLCLFLLYSIISLAIISQTHDLQPSTFTVANASVADSKYYSAFKNPASLGAIENSTLGIQYENKFIISQLAKKSFYSAFQNKLLNVGLTANFSGYELYNELLTGIALSKNFNNTFLLGVQYNYYSVYVAETNKRYAAFFPQVGVIARISPSVSIGFSTFNPAQQTIQFKYLKKQIPSVFSLGTDWKISDELNFLFQTDKNISGNYRFAGGFEYVIKDFLTVRTGAYQAEYLTPCVGFGLKLETFIFQINNELHPILGLTTMAAIQYSFSKR